MRRIARSGIAVLLTLLCGCGSDPGRSAGREADAAEVESSAATVTAIQTATAPSRRSSAPRLGENSAAPRGRLPADGATTGPTVQISGRVTFDDGTPVHARVSSVTVELWAAAPASNAPVDAEGIAQLDQRLDSASLNEQGRYVVSGPDGENRRVEVKGVSRAVAGLPSPDAMTTAPRRRALTQNFLIPAPHDITGRVVDAQDQPVASALVSLRSEDVITDGWYYGNQQTTTSATGDFTLTGVAAGSATLGAAASGYGAVTRDISVPTSGAIVLRLTTGTTTLHGHVLQYPTDAPLAGARVTIQPVGASQTLGLAGVAGAETRTANDGSFQLSNLSAGDHRFRVWGADSTELFSAPGQENKAAMTPKLLDGQTTAATLRVFAGYTITGLVFDKATSEPLPGAQVTAYRASTPMQHDTTGDDGMFKLDRIGSDWDALLDVTLDGYVLSPETELRFRSGRYMRSPDFPENSDQVRTDVPMLMVVNVSGRVDNSDGLPVADAEVKWEGTDQITQNLGNNTDRTDSDGRFTLELAPFQNGLLEVEAAGYAFTRSDGVNIASLDIDDIVVVLQSGGSVTGRVVNPDGEGVAGASIQVREQYSIGGSFAMGTRALAESGAGGQFQIDSLPVQQNVPLKAVADGYSPGTLSVNLQPGEVKTGIEIKLAEELTIEGRVVDSDDNPVRATLSGIGFRVTQTDEQGAFKITGLSPGEVQIFVNPMIIGPSETVDAKAGTKDLVIRFGEKERSVAHCKVIDGVTKRPIENFDVKGVGRVSREGEGPGGFSFSIRPGSFMMPEVSAEGYVTRTFEVQAPKEAGDFEVTLEMGVGSGVSGRIVDAAGDPVAGVPVAVYETRTHGGTMGKGPAGNSVSDKDGQFLIAGVPAGKARVSAMPRPPSANVSKEAELKDGEVFDVGDLVIGEVGSISGKIILTPSGDPVSGAYVNFNAQLHGEHFSQLVITEADGAFHLPNLQPGEYKIWVNGRQKTVEVESGENVETVIELGNTTVIGTLSRQGAPAFATIAAVNQQTGETVTAITNPENGKYILQNLVSGNYQIGITPIFNSDNPQTEENTWNHSEIFTVPDEASVQKDFVVP